MSSSRKNNIERITSPDQMDDFIRVTTPPVWIALAAMVVLLVVILVWSIFGSMELHDDNGNTYEIHPITYVTN